MTRRIVASTLTALALAAPAFAQGRPPAVRSIGQVVAVSHDSLQAVTTAVQVAGGKVYVNDLTGRRLLMYDSTLSTMTVVADTSGEHEAYGSQPGTLLPYHGDSALFISPSTLSMLVLTPQGTVARVMATPTSQRGFGALIGNIFGTPGFDARGRLVFFTGAFRITNRQGPPGGDGQPFTMEPPDTAYVVGFDFAARTTDTLAAIRIPRSRTTIARDDQGKMHVTMTAFPPQTVDDWGVTSDGRLAVLRGQDYHVDWLGGTGSWTATPRMPFSWEHLDDAQKQALVDSTQAALQAQMDSMPARMQRQAGATVSNDRGADGGNRQTMTVVIGGPPGGGDGGRGGPGGPNGAPAGHTRFQMSVPTVIKAAPTDVADYRPAFTQASLRTDRDGNLWVRTTDAQNGQPVYDIVNGSGELTDRVQLPAFRTIAGFGPGVVYLGVRDTSGVMHLEKARVR